MKKIVVITGAGISAESGISTFRDSDGLWEKYKITDVATPDGWYRNPQLVLDFYNQRRKELMNCQPNAAHIGLAELESNFDVQIITQNIDNLHERAGSSNVLHLHGELTKACDLGKQKIVDIGYNDIKLGDKIGNSQMRPFIVWFEEAVPEIDKAIELVKIADIALVIGTSLKVYPAAGLLSYINSDAPIYLIDPNEVETYNKNIHFLQMKATEGVKEFRKLVGM